MLFGPLKFLQILRLIVDLRARDLEIFEILGCYSVFMGFLNKVLIEKVWTTPYQSLYEHVPFPYRCRISRGFRKARAFLRKSRSFVLSEK